ncbi:MAG: ribosome silencing factor [Lachnospiraceae bacterium]|nr:ribosome silencing factor [Lachnospiraceae bacterium]
MILESKEKADIAIAALEDKKGEDVKIIDVSSLTEIADYFVLATANNKNQLEALVDAVEERMGKNGIIPKNIEGRPQDNTQWILMDYNDIIVHIFTKEGRDFYDLERIWKK